MSDDFMVKNRRANVITALNKNYRKLNYTSGYSISIPQDIVYSLDWEMFDTLKMTITEDGGIKFNKIEISMTEDGELEDNPIKPTKHIDVKVRVR